ncbi:hypothetical protein NECID01_2155 [Nematocida sp. AWRm77]|nr:hypothetical protein NECID01_2155 [Nematocida sp. AWRm77]
MNGRTRFPLSLSASSETTARGTGLGAQRGKKTLLSLTLVGGGGERRARRLGGGVRGVRDHWRAAPPPHAGRASRARGGRLPAGSLAGAARLQERIAAVQRRAQRGGKPGGEHKGRSPPERARRAPARGNPGLAIPRRLGRRAAGGGKVTTGITGLWRPSVHSDAAF